MKSQVAGIILAAGKGTRMKSALPKCLHPVCGLPMAQHVGRAMCGAGVMKPVVVIGFEGEQLKKSLGESYQYAEQREQLGTGHAAMMAQQALMHHHGPVFISPGDTPLLTSEIFLELLEHHLKGSAQMTILTCLLEDPTGYGRVVRGVGGMPTRIVEEKDATSEEKNIQEINTGIYCFEKEALFGLLPKLNNQNAQGEYYLTDLACLISQQQGKIETLITQHVEHVMGVNDRWQLAETEQIKKREIMKQHAYAGVTIVDPLTTVIEADVSIGADTTVFPMTSLKGQTRIGANCLIGPSTLINASIVGESCRIQMSLLEDVTVEDEARIGPFAHLRQKAKIGKGVKVGNFVEIKNSELSEGAKASHLAYLGDATIGENSNIGAGTITCNYDGIEKHRTQIGQNVFIGSNSTLVAPVKIEDDSFVGAGSVITQDVPKGSLALGRARQVIKELWAQQLLERRKAKKS